MFTDRNCLRCTILIKPGSRGHFSSSFKVFLFYIKCASDFCLILENHLRDLTSEEGFFLMKIHRMRG